MTDTKHTPGPWHAGEGNAEKIVYGPDKWAICDCKTYYSHSDEEKGKANARLIAAAPETAAERDKLKAINAELLEALEFALKALYAPDCPAIPDGAMVKGKIYSAIAKAKGE